MSGFPPGFVPPPLDNTIGAVLVGVIVSSSIYGITCLQTWQFFTSQREKRDSLWLRSAVATLWILETLHSACISHAIYYYSITKFGQYLALTEAVWSIILPVFINCLIGSIVQFCFAYRVYVLSERKIVVVALILLGSVAQLGSGLAMTIIGFRVRQLAKLIFFKGIITTSLTTTAITDILIAAALCYYLFTKRGELQGTNKVLDGIINYAINCGVLCSFFAITGLITFLTMPDNLINFAVNFILGKAYSNAFLASLNARDTLRGQLRTHQSTSQISGPTYTLSERTLGVTSGSEQHYGVKMSTNVIVGDPGRYRL